LGYEKIGRIETGWQADLILINADLPTPLQEHNLLEQMLLYRNAENVSGVMVAGERKVINGEVLNADWTQLQAKTREAAARLWSEA
jgi:cytosine/adenosine deaminase-related metal-dependent hydrolase